jgi:hypothetical protein
VVQEPEIVTVFETGNAALVALAKSMLDAADIVYAVKGENVQNLFGGGVIGTGFNILVGPVQIQVRREDEAEARGVLSDLSDT